MSSIKKKIAINTITGWCSIAIQLATGMILVPFLLKHLGTEGYGIIGLIGTIIGFSELADMGLRRALSRELSENVAKQDIEGFRIYSSTALILYLTIALVIILINWFISPFLADFFKVSPDLKVKTIELIRFYASISILISFIKPVFSSGLQSFFKFNIINNIMSVNKIISSILMFIFISYLPFDPLFIWTIISAFFMIFSLAVNYYYYKKECYGGKISLKYVNFKRVKSLFKLGGVMYVLQLTNTMAVRADPLIISYYFGPAGIALYNVGAKLSILLKPIVLTLSSQMTPLTTKFHIQKEEYKQHKLLIDGTKYTLYLGIFFSMGIILFSKWFSYLWLFNSIGEDYLIVAKVMKFWAIANIATYAGAMQWSIALAMKKVNFALWLNIPSSIINVCLSFFFVGFTDYGISGVLIGTIITEIIRRPIATWYTAKISKLSLLNYFKNGYLKPFLYLLMLLLPLFILHKYNISYTWTKFIGSITIFTVYTLILLLAFEYKLILNQINYYYKKRRTNEKIY